MRNLNREVLCVILGGGAGSRLYPLTARRSKPAVPLAGKYRLIDIFSPLSRHRPTKTGFKAQPMQSVRL